MQASTTAQRSDRDTLVRVRFSATVRKSFSSQSTLLGRREHCSLDPERLATAGLTVGAQIRVRRDPLHVALFTVSETRQETVHTTMRMALPARERLGTTDEFEGTVDTQVPCPTLSDDEAQRQGEFVERLTDHGHQQGLVAIAPHGGMIERRTDQQAERVGALLGCDHCSVWRCRGFSTRADAFERWHITSGEIHPPSFPLLNTIVSRRFAHAVSFHGFSGDHVLIGGAAPRAFKQEIARALQRVLSGTGIPVRIAGRSDNYDGDDPRNIVNRLTAGGAGGVQIEQSVEARERFWEAIADGVVSVYRRR